LDGRPWWQTQARRILRRLRRRPAAPSIPTIAIPSFYPTSAANRPHYGYGRPPHEAIARLLDRGVEAYRRELDRFVEYVPDLLNIPREEVVSTEPCWNNTWFTGLDAVSLYGYLRSRQPRRYLEIGSGHSTRFAARAKRDGGLATDIVSIDPAPRAEVDGLCNEIVRQPLETLELDEFARLEPGDIVLVDSSRRVFMNSDTVTFHLDVLPVLPAGVLVGIHDVYWPLDYPPHLSGAYLSEQYLVGAMLLAEPTWFRASCSRARALPNGTTLLTCSTRCGRTRRWRVSIGRDHCCGSRSIGRGCQRTRAWQPCQDPDDCSQTGS
jgi:hypothetical protein